MTQEKFYIEVAVALPVYTTYTYQVPDALTAQIQAGCRVLAPFGQRQVTGYILGRSEPDGSFAVKNILDILDAKPLFPPDMLPFFRWIADYYMHPLGEVIKTALPGGLHLYEWAELSLTEAGQACLSEADIPSLEREVLEVLTTGPVLQKAVQNRLKKTVPAGLIQRLVTAGWIRKQMKLKGKRSGSRAEPWLRFLRDDLPADLHQEKRKAVLDYIRQFKEGISQKALKNAIPGAKNRLPYLIKNDYLSKQIRAVYRDPLGDPIPPDSPPDLTTEQEQVVATVCDALGNGFQAYLLSGVTGSGKTEVYMRIAAAAMQKGESTLILVPEIALISQTERRFRARFGECVAVLHSGLTAGERYDQWERILKKQVPIVIGARSALFAPLKQLGVIIVDEEHDTSYKQESRFRYNARDLAVVRAKQQKAVALLGSATPSLQSYYNADAGKFKRLQLTRRVMDRPLPEVQVVDLCRYRDERGIRRIITPELMGEIKKTLARGEQVLLFLNRRGFANYPVCASCGEPVTCKNCDISLTLHKRLNALKCHLCGFSKASVSLCDNCGSASIKMLGMGTEKIAAIMTDLFPEARVARMDRDTTATKGSLLKILKELKNNKIDILVGTQMVAKGHDFPNITLVGIVCADLSLNFPDFRSSEQTYQILAQVAGRAGRGSTPGRVILQTYNPDHFAIATARKQEYEAFYNQEIMFRRALNYPPFSRIIQLRISGKDPKATQQHALRIGECCRQIQEKDAACRKSIQMLGPVEAPLARISGHHRWQILLKGSPVNQLHTLTHRLLFTDPALLNHRGVMVAIDVDPFSML